MPEYENASLSMRRRNEPGSKETQERSWQIENADRQTTTVRSGIDIDRSELWWNVRESIRRGCEPRSKTAHESQGHKEKLFVLSTPSAAGNQTRRVRNREEGYETVTQHSTRETAVHLT